MKRVELGMLPDFAPGAEAAIKLDESDMHNFNLEIVVAFANGIGAVAWLASLGNMVVIQFPGYEAIQQQLIPIGSIEHQIQEELARRIKQ